jgi:hypothetical protein
MTARGHGASRLSPPYACVLSCNKYSAALATLSREDAASSPHERSDMRDKPSRDLIPDIASLIRATPTRYYGRLRSRHPEVRAQRASKDERPGAVALRGPLRGHLRVTDNYAALAPFSAIPTSTRKMPVAPLRRSGGVSHSSKNTTFMSGRTRAPSGCLAM